MEYNMTACRYALVYCREIKYDDIAWSLVKMGLEVEIIDSDLSVHSTMRSDVEMAKELLVKNRTDVAISMDFIPVFSDACEELGIKYISWVFDSPQEALYKRQVRNVCNYIFSFDQVQTQTVRECGGKNVFHLPLATNIYRNTAIVIDHDDERKYSCEISFVGSMYTDDMYPGIVQAVSNETKKEIDDILQDAYGKWDGIDRIYKRVSDTALSELWGIIKGSLGEDYPISPDEYIGTRLFAGTLARRERLDIMMRLSGYNTRLYTSSQGVDVPGTKVFGPLSYDEELPKNYFLSKINLNITLHSILSGVPLRVFDIMGVGGFMLTNYQPEVEELFTIGRDLEVYQDIDELEDKVRYYLKNDSKRQQIALNGYRRVSEKYSYDERVKYILDVIKG